MKFVVRFLSFLFISFLPTQSYAQEAWYFGPAPGINARGLLEHMAGQNLEIRDMLFVGDAYVHKGSGMHPDLSNIRWFHDVMHAGTCAVDSSIESMANANMGFLFGNANGDAVDGLSLLGGLGGFHYSCAANPEAGTISDRCYRDLLADAASWSWYGTDYPAVALLQYYDDSACYTQLGGRSNLKLDENLQAENLIVIASAGDENSEELTYPSNDTRVWTAVALDSSGEKTTWSNHGSLADFAVPGAGVDSLWWEAGVPKYRSLSSDYFYSSNSAASVLAGAASLLARCAYWGAGIRGNLRGRVYSALVSTAVKGAGIPGASLSKHGLIDVDAAAVTLGCIGQSGGPGQIVEIKEPGEGAELAVSQLVRIETTPVDENAVVQLKVDGELITTLRGQSPFTFTWDTSELLSGVHLFSAEKIVNGESVGVDIQSVVKPELEEYEVFITSPTNDQKVTGSLAISVRTSPEDVGHVELRIDDNLVAQLQGGSPYSWNWNTTGLPRRNYSISVDFVVEGRVVDSDRITVPVVDPSELIEIVSPHSGSRHALGDLTVDVMLGGAFESVRLRRANCVNCPLGDIIEEVSSPQGKSVSFGVSECRGGTKYYVAEGCFDSSCAQSIVSNYVAVSFLDDTILFPNEHDGKLFGLQEFEATLYGAPVDGSNVFLVVEDSSGTSYLPMTLVLNGQEAQGLPYHQYRHYWSASSLEIGAEVSISVQATTACGLVTSSVQAATVVPELRMNGLLDGDTLPVPDTAARGYDREIVVRSFVEGGAQHIAEVQLYALFEDDGEEVEYLLGTDSGSDKGSVLNPFTVSFRPISQLLLPVLSQYDVDLLNSYVTFELRSEFLGGEEDIPLDVSANIRFVDYWVEVQDPKIPWEPFVINRINTDTGAGFQIEVHDGGGFLSVGEIEAMEFGVDCDSRGNCDSQVELEYEEDRWIGSWVPESCLPPESVGSWDIIVTTYSENGAWDFADFINWENEGVLPCGNNILSPGSGGTLVSSEFDVFSNVDLNSSGVDESRGVELLIDGSPSGLISFGEKEQHFRSSSLYLGIGEHSLSLRVYHPEGFPKILSDKHMVVVPEENEEKVSILSPTDWEIFTGDVLEVIMDYREQEVRAAGCMVENKAGLDQLVASSRRCELELPAGTYRIRAWVENHQGERFVSEPRVVQVKPYEEACFMLRNPSSGDILSDTVQISVDSEGCDEPLGKVVFARKNADGFQVIAEDSQAPYSFLWDTTAETNGSARVFVFRELNQGSYPGEGRLGSTGPGAAEMRYVDTYINNIKPKKPQLEENIVPR